MSADIWYPSEFGKFEEILENVNECIDLESRFPNWPFKLDAKVVDICQSRHAIEGPFGGVLQEIVDAHGDTSISYLTIDPTARSYKEHYGLYSAFRIAGRGLSDTYWEAVSYEPEEGAIFAPCDTADIAAIVGSTGQWAIWIDGGWDFAVVLSNHDDGPWKSASEDVPFVSIEEALSDFIEPYFLTPLSDEDRAKFKRNFQSREARRSSEN